MGGIRWYMVLWELQIKKKNLQQHTDVIGKLINGSNVKIGKNTSTKLPLPILHATHGWYWAPEKTSKLNDSRLCGLFG
jgi:hypothetical protein